MTTEKTRVLQVEAPATRWQLSVWQVGPALRAELEDPGGVLAWVKHCPSLEDTDEADGVFTAVRAFFAVRDLYHVGVSLIETARAELQP